MNWSVWVSSVLLGSFLFCLTSSTSSVTTAKKSDVRRVRRYGYNNNNCKPGRRARSYADTARLWERDITELRLYLDETLSDLGRQLDLLRTQVADVGNDVSRLTSDNVCDSNQSPIDLRLERLENNLARMMIRMEEHMTRQQRAPTASSLVDEPEPKPNGRRINDSISKKDPPLDVKTLTPADVKSTAAPTPSKQTYSPKPCIVYELSAPETENGAFLRQTTDKEDDLGLQVCSRLDPGEQPKSVPSDCSEVPSPRRAGVYWIQPQGTAEAIRVYCDAEGWTVIQRRGVFPHSHPVSFNRRWSSYAQGFGNLCEEFWLGNSHLHRITTAYNVTLRVELNGGKGSQKLTRASYNRFQVGNEKQGFVLTVGKYSGDAKDGLGFQSGMPFATKDRAWSQSALACADLEASGWWISETAYSHFIQCNHHLLGSNLNAPYVPFTTLQEELVKLCVENNGTKQYQHIKYANAIYWRGRYTTNRKGFTTVEMKIRPIL